MRLSRTRIWPLADRAKPGGLPDLIRKAIGEANARRVKVTLPVLRCLAGEPEPVPVPVRVRSR